MREAHVLKKTKTQRLPERVVYFDSESEVFTKITEDEIRGAEQGKEVWKKHSPYLICATFRDSRKNKRERRSYGAPEIKGQKNPKGHPNFLSQFWVDVDAYTPTGKTVYVLAHNCKYDIQVTGGIKYLIARGYKVVGFSDESPFVVNLIKYITHSPRDGKPYGKIVDKEPPAMPEGIYDEETLPYPLKDGRWFMPEPKTKEIQILSSTNYYQASLAKLGETFGIAKMEFDHNEQFTVEKAYEYCGVDVDILEKAMEEFFTFIDREELGGFSITVAGQAFRAYRHRFMNHELYIHDNEDALKVERLCYCGGRTEVFHMGEIPETSFYVDVNSMYPAVMWKEKYPTKLISFWKLASLPDVMRKIKQGYLVCAEVKVRTSKNIYPLKRKRLLFPISPDEGFWTGLCTPEIEKAYEEGHIVEIRNVCIYEGENIFAKYVSYFYGERLKAKERDDEVLSFLYKLFLNCLYGKFGQRDYKMEAIGTAPPEELDVFMYTDYETGRTEQVKVFGGKIWRKTVDEDHSESYNSFPAIAAHVTAHARIKLWNAIEVSGKGNIHYMDTDSLICTHEGFMRMKADGLIDSSTLGMFKLEDYGQLTTFGVKDYVFESALTGKTSVKIKGVSKTAVPLPSSPDGHLRFATTQWGGFSTRLKNKDMGEYSNRVIIKELKREYNKGNIKGGVVMPFVISDDEKEYREFMKKELKKEMPEDHISYLINNTSFIKCPRKNNIYYSEYAAINIKSRLKYFRAAQGLNIDEWCDENKITVSELFNLIRAQEIK